MLLFGFGMVLIMIWKPRGLIATREPSAFLQGAPDHPRLVREGRTRMSAARSAPVLRVEHLSMRFGGLVAVDDLSFSAARGDITALIGPNGAGKTTVFNCITGFYKPTEGRIALRTATGAIWNEIDTLTDRGTRSLRHGDGALFLLERMPDYLVTQQARVARTFQNIRLFPGMTVFENLLVAQHNTLMVASGFTFLGVFAPHIYGRAEKAAVEKARYWLDKINLIDRADDPAGDLPYGAQRRLEIARAMCTDPVLLCLDEPAAGLNPRESARAQRTAALDPRRARDLDPADRARHVGGDGDFRPRGRARLRREDLRRHAGGGAQRPEGDRRLSRRRGRGSREGRGGGGAVSALLARARRCKTSYGKIAALKGVDIDVADGEIVTLIGANGAGKSTLMMTIFGNPRAREGSIVFDGQDITRLPTHEIARLRIAQAPEGRRIFSRMTVLENLQMGAIVAGETDFADDLEKIFTLFPRLKERLHQRGGTLSGGEQQMLAIARALMARPRLLLLDEPSLGLAPLIVRQIFDAIRELNKTREAHRVPGGAERLPCAQARASRLRHGQRPDHALGHRQGTARAAGGEVRLSGRRAAGGRGASMNGIVYEEDYVGLFLLVTVVLGGGAAWLAGRAIAATWRPWWHVAGYMLILGAAVRFMHFALFEGTLLSLHYYLVDTIVCLIFGFLGFRVTRVAQMTTQYGWINVRAGFLRWARRRASNSGKGS